MNIRYSLGKNTYDNRPVNREADSFFAFGKTVLGTRSKKKGEAYIACPFNGDGTRKRDGALPRAWLPFDFDSISDQETFAELCLYLSRYRGFGYTTASHTPDKPRARAILAASREMSRGECKRVCLAIDREIQQQFSGRVGLDASVYRAEQPIYTPLVDAQSFVWPDGEIVDVDAVLETAPTIEEERTASMRIDDAAEKDPVLRRLSERQMVLKDMGSGRFGVVCPLSDGHTSKSSDTSTVYMLPNFGGVKYGKFHCLHSHCADKSQEDFLRALSFDPKTVWAQQKYDISETDVQSVKTDVPRFSTIDASELIQREFKPIRWAVPGIIPEGVTLLAGAPKIGKALRHGEVVPTPLGWSKIENLRVGDIVFAGDGSETKVTWTKTWTDRPCWRLHFDNGSTVDADENHEWETVAARGGRAIRTTKEIVETLRIKEKGRIRANHTIPISSIKTNHSDLSLDPYQLGVYLADGTRRDGYITTGDPEVFEHFDVAVSRTKWNRYGYKVAELRGKVKTLGVLQEKRIPDAYLRASFDQRLALFQGLMDSDGWIGTKPNCEICISYPNLAADILELARSLGIKAKSIESDSKLNGRIVGKRNRITFRTGLPIFRLARKAARQKPVGTRVQSVRIIGATPLGNHQTTCIEVDHPDHMFLCGRGFIPTHNSWAALDIAIAIVCGGVVFGSVQVDPGEVLYLALEDNDRRMKSRLNKSLRGGKIPAGLHLTYDVPRIDQGLIEALESFVSERPSIRLVIVDTIKPVRPVEKKNDRIYDADYSVGRPFLGLASRFNISILLIHHTNKTKSEDELDTVSGSTGLAGGVDNVLVLKRARASAEAVLYVTGRDIEHEGRFGLIWDQANAMWMMNDEGPRVSMSPERKVIYDVVRDVGPITARDIACVLNPGVQITRTSKEWMRVRFLVGKLRAEGHVEMNSNNEFVVKNTRQTRYTAHEY